MITDMINDRYYKRNNPQVAIAECYDLVEEISALSEGIFSSATAGAVKGAGKAALGAGKAGGGFAGRVFGNMAKGTANVANNTVLNNAAGQTVRYQYERVKQIFIEIFKKMMKMIDNLVQSVFSYQKRLDRLVKDIDKAISNRTITGENQNDSEVLTPKGLGAIGLDITVEGSRAALIVSYFKTLKEGGSILDGIRFHDEKTERGAIELLFERIVGEKRPFDNITEKDMEEAVIKRLDIFANLNKDISASSKNKLTKGVKDVVKGVFGKGPGASIDSKQLQMAREKVKGDDLVSTLEATLNTIRNSAAEFVKLEGVTFLKDEKKHLAEIESSLEKLLSDKKAADQTIKRGNETNEKFQKSELAGQAADDKAAAQKQQTASQQSVWDEKLFDSIVRAGYAEDVYNDRSGKPIVNPSANQPGGGSAPMTLEAMKKDHKLLTIFFTRYSRVLTETIQNCGSVFEALLTAGKSALSEYYKVTK